MDLWPLSNKLWLRIALVFISVGGGECMLGVDREPHVLQLSKAFR